VGPGERIGRCGQTVCSLHSVSLTFLKPAIKYGLVLSILCVSRKHTMLPKPAMMAAWLGKAPKSECGTVIHCPSTLSPQIYQVVRSEENTRRVTWVE